MYRNLPYTIQLLSEKKILSCSVIYIDAASKFSLNLKTDRNSN